MEVAVHLVSREILISEAKELLLAPILVYPATISEAVTSPQPEIAYYYVLPNDEILDGIKDTSEPLDVLIEYCKIVDSEAHYTFLVRIARLYDVALRLMHFLELDEVLARAFAYQIPNVSSKVPHAALIIYTAYGALLVSSIDLPFHVRDGASAGRMVASGEITSLFSSQRLANLHFDLPGLSSLISEERRKLPPQVVNIESPNVATLKQAGAKCLSESVYVAAPGNTAQELSTYYYYHARKGIPNRRT